MGDSQLVDVVSQAFGKGSIVFHVGRDGLAFKDAVDDGRQHHLRDRSAVADGKGVKAALVTADAAAEIEIFL